MTSPIIKQDRMKSSEWSALVDVLRRINQHKAAAAIKDNRVTDAEMNSLLDRNGDGHVDAYDFRSVGNSLFVKIKEILKKYKFSAYNIWKPNFDDPYDYSGTPAQFWSDRDFVLSAVKHCGEALKYASNVLKKDRQIVLAAMANQVEAMKYADATLKRDKKFILNAAKRQLCSLAYAHMSLRRNKAFMLAAIKLNAYALQYAATAPSESREVVLAAVKRNGTALFWAPPKFSRDRKIVLAAVRQNGNALEYASAALKRNREIVLAAVQQNGLSLRFAHKWLTRNRRIALAAVKNTPYALEHVHSSLKRDWRILRIAVKQCAIDSSLIPEGKRWKVLQGDLELRRFFTRRELKDLPSFKKALRNKYNIEFIRRFASFNELIEILNNRRTAASPTNGKPLCIIISPKKDHSNSFENSRISNMIELGYRVIYHEAGSEQEVVKHLKSATVNGLIPAKAIILGGHGDSKSLSLGAKGCTLCYRDERLYIDTSDFQGRDDLQLARYLQPDGDLILESCLTGRGGALNSGNLANTIARTLYAGMMVHSYTTSTSIKRILKIGGRLKVVLLNDDDKGYRVWGSKRRPPATLPLPIVKGDEILTGWDII